MGTWDTGIFDNDEALDYVGELIDSLASTINEFCGADEPDLSDGEGRVVPSLAIIQLLSEHCGAAPPKAEQIEAWRKRYLKVYDEQIDDFEPAEGFKSARRETIARAFRNLESTANKFWGNGNDLPVQPAVEVADKAHHVAGHDCRRFELVDGTSNKYWEIELASKSFSVRWGRIGTAGQSQTKDFPTEDKARHEYEKLVEEKLKKGYLEV
jgi:predicted DNA-binding WGR domain protein